MIKQSFILILLVLIKFCAIGQTNSNPDNTKVKVFITSTGTKYIGFRYNDVNQKLMVINEREKALSLINVSLERQINNLFTINETCDSINKLNHNIMESQGIVIGSQQNYMVMQRDEIANRDLLIDKLNKKNNITLKASITTIILSFLAGVVLF